MAEVVDIHPHIIAANSERYPTDPIGGKQSTWSKERPASFEQLVEQMDASGVDKAAIVHSSTVYGFDNSYVADAIADHVDRFVGVGSVDMRGPDAPATIDRWMSMPGMVGLRIFTTGSTLPGQAYELDDPETYAAWGHAVERGISVCVQMTTAAIPDLHRVLDRFPGAVVIIDHFAKPDVTSGPPYPETEPLLTLADREGVYLKLTPRVLEYASEGRSTPEELLEFVTARFGANRIAWGSNYPNDVGTLAEIRASIEASLVRLSDSDREWIMGRTALEIYPELKS